jgi:hypothetical protein
MALTIKNITELPSGTPTATSPFIYGVGDNLFRSTLQAILDLTAQGITDLSFSNIDTTVTYIDGSAANPLNAVNITIAPGELTFIRLKVISTDNLLTENTYLVPLGAGTYNPLGTTLAFSDLILVEKKIISLNPSGSNTVTYVATDLADINSRNPALDFSDTTKIYFVDLDDGFYRFVGTAGLYGFGELQMVQGDLVSVEQPVDFPQPVTATPPISGTFSIALNNYFGTDYSGTVTSLANIDIASGAVLGGFARIKGNWASEPTVTGATQAANSVFTPNVDIYAYFEKWNDGVVYWFNTN